MSKIYMQWLERGLIKFERRDGSAAGQTPWPTSNRELLDLHLKFVAAGVQGLPSKLLAGILELVNQNEGVFGTRGNREYQKPWEEAQVLALRDPATKASAKENWVSFDEALHGLFCDMTAKKKSSVRDLFAWRAREFQERKSEEERERKRLDQQGDDAQAEGSWGRYSSSRGGGPGGSRGQGSLGGRGAGSGGRRSGPRPYFWTPILFFTFLVPAEAGPGTPVALWGEMKSQWVHPTILGLGQKAGGRRGPFWAPRPAPEPPRSASGPKHTVSQAQLDAFIQPGGLQMRARGPGWAEVGEEVSEWAQDRISGRLATGTAKAYRAAWEKWEFWCKTRDRRPVFTREEARSGDIEEELLTYAGFWGWLGKSPGTVRQLLFGIQHMHARFGAPDPLADVPRVWLFLEGLAKETAPNPRKLGVTAGMMAWLGQKLRADQSPEERARQEGPATRERRVNDAALWASLCLAFFFCLRAGEYCDPGKVDPKKIIRGLDIGFFDTEGEALWTGQADKLAVQFREQKADQQAFGMNRAQYRSGGVVCVVQAVCALRTLCPERFGKGKEAQLPICRWADGTVIKRTEIQQALQQAAEAKGLPADRFRSHSLRIGGASAIYHATGDIEVVKRYGRWTSGAFHRYLWDSDEQHKDLAAKMAESVATIHYT